MKMRFLYIATIVGMFTALPAYAQDLPSLEDILKSAEPVKTAPAEPWPEMENGIPYDANMPLPQNVGDSISKQLIACWAYILRENPEAKEAHIQMVLWKDGSIRGARLRPSELPEYHANAEFRHLVDSALRATRNPKCVPLKGLPVDQYAAWSKVEVVFDPRKIPIRPLRNK